MTLQRPVFVCLVGSVVVLVGDGKLRNSTECSGMFHPTARGPWLLPFRQPFCGIQSDFAAVSGRNGVGTGSPCFKCNPDLSVSHRLVSHRVFFVTRELRCVDGGVGLPQSGTDCPRENMDVLYEQRGRHFTEVCAMLPLAGTSERNRPWQSAVELNV